MSSEKMAKLTGWLLVLGTAVAALMVVIKPGTFTTEHPDGATASMMEAVRKIADNSELAHISVEVSLFATFAYLVGFYGVERLFRDGGWADFMRKVGLMAIFAGYVTRVASYAMAHLAGNILTHGMEGTEGSVTAVDAAILMAGMEGTLGVFASVILRMGIVLFALSLMNSGLLGTDKVSASLLAIVPGVGSLLFLLLGSHIHEGAINIYLMGGLLGFIQAAWVILLGVGFIRKADALPASS